MTQHSDDYAKGRNQTREKRCDLVIAAGSVTMRQEFAAFGSTVSRNMKLSSQPRHQDCSLEHFRIVSLTRLAQKR